MYVLRTLIDCAGMALLAVACSLTVYGDDSPARPRQAATPEQAVEFLLTAAKEDDLQTALGQMPDDEDVMLQRPRSLTGG